MALIENLGVAFVRTRIAGYKCPKSALFVGELPHMPTGKVEKAALRRQNS
jgi:acyl-CoA synthetase (AMP-forming)/AMP-acid ligase II